ncbi:hypothetical protein HK098_008322 [Nowakowskiella sp. JEL0407]|nr:hypothetical protein HK098_008322 [Nowakowskiella sp. JEL0407]
MTLYPAISPFSEGFLQVGSDKLTVKHSVYYEQSGNPSGNPVIYVHGGPGGGTSPTDRQYFDPNAYRVILFDQRGSGKSTPSASLEENDTWSLVSDMEKLREHLGIDKWVVFGGSWGSTLALTYAATHPDRVKALILRGIFLLRKCEIDWFYQEGASYLFPDYYSEYIAQVPEENRGDILAYYYRLLTDTQNPEKQLSAARAWSKWECATSRLIIDSEMIKKAEGDAWALKFARIECHYFVNEGFFECDGWILKNVEKFRNIPAVIVQGRYDVVCPMKSAWDLHRMWPEADFHVIPDAGHSAKEDGIRAKLVEAADKFKSL